MTRDHSLPEDSYKEAKPDMTEEEQKTSSQERHHTGLGMRESVQVDIRHDTLLPGDTIFLCCDGLTGMIDDQSILKIVLAAGEDPESRR